MESFGTINKFAFFLTALLSLYSTPPILPTVPSSLIVPVPTIFNPFVISFSTSELYIERAVINPPLGPDSLLSTLTFTLGLVSYSLILLKSIPIFLPSSSFI